MPLILCECALHRFRPRPPIWTLLIKVISKFTLALKQWLVCTIFSAIILLHLQIHSSKIYSLIFLHVFILISLITLLMNTPRMKNQFIRSTCPFLLFIPMIRPICPKNFYFPFCILLMQLQIFYHKDGHSTYKRAAGRERPTTQTKARRP